MSCLDNSLLFSIRVLIFPHLDVCSLFTLLPKMILVVPRSLAITEQSCYKRRSVCAGFVWTCNFPVYLGKYQGSSTAGLYGKNMFETEKEYADIIFLSAIRKVSCCSISLTWSFGIASAPDFGHFNRCVGVPAIFVEKLLGALNMMH